MPAIPSRGQTFLPQTLTYLAAVGLALLYFAHRFHADFNGLQPFWDAHVYARALAHWHTGANPYFPPEPPRPDTILPFVSPPVFLYANAAMGRIVSGQPGFALFCCLTGVATLAVPTLLAGFYLRGTWMTPALALLITWFQPGRHGSQAFLTGNISNVLYAALLASGIPGVRRNRWLPFYAILFAAALLKPPFLAFLLLPLLAGRRQWGQSLAVVILVVAGGLAQRLIAPALWHSFQEAVLTRVFQQGDAGFGLLGQWTSLAAHLGALRRVNASVVVLLMLVPLVASLFLLEGHRPGSRTQPYWVPCLLVLAILCNPRILDYDINAAIVPAVWIAVEFFRKLPPRRYRGLRIGVPLLLFLDLEASHNEAALCLLLLSAVLMVIVQLVWPTYFEPHQPARTPAADPSSSDTAPLAVG